MKGAKLMLRNTEKVGGVQEVDTASPKLTNSLTNELRKSCVCVQFNLLMLDRIEYAILDHNCGESVNLSQGIAGGNQRVLLTAGNSQSYPPGTPVPIAFRRLFSKNPQLSIGYFVNTSIGRLKAGSQRPAFTSRWSTGLTPTWPGITAPLSFRRAPTSHVTRPRACPSEGWGSRVQVVGRWILARLRHRRFFSLAELSTPRSAPCSTS
jgi:hypothetical protein